MLLERYKEYTKKDVHDILDPESTYYYFCGKWGINGVVRYGTDHDKFALFVTLGKDETYHGRIQTLSPKGELTWSTPLKGGANTANTRKLLRSGRIGQDVHIFCRRKNDYTSDKDKMYIYVGKGRQPEVVDDGELPQLVVWKIEDLDQNNPNVKHLIS